MVVTHRAPHAQQQQTVFSAGLQASKSYVEVFNSQVSVVALADVLMFGMHAGVFVKRSFVRIQQTHTHE